MKSISEFSKKPQLIKIEIDSEDIIDSYGESIIFYTYEFVDVSTYFDFFQSQSLNETEQLNKILRKLILNAQGEPVIDETRQLPADIGIQALIKINEHLGKSKTKPLMNKVGAQPD